MKTVAGLWIDHRKAIIVTESDRGEKTKEILSHVEKQPGRFDGKRPNTPFEALQVKADDRLQRVLTKHLNGFYEKVQAYLGDAESLLIFGPGEAKGELKHHLEHNNHRGTVVAMETADKMTDRQIAAKVHRYFVREKRKGE